MNGMTILKIRQSKLPGKASGDLATLDDGRTPVARGFMRLPAAVTTCSLDGREGRAV